MPEPQGQVLRDGRYAITRLLGEGAQAATLEAVDKRDGRLVAIKRFRVKGASSWKEVELAEREAKVMAALSHPLIPRYIEHFEEQGELFLVTEKIEGQSLLALKQKGVLFSEEEIIRFLRDIAESLDYLHSRIPPVVHRDIKPSNVMKRADGRYVLIDFGAVRDRMKPEGGSTVVGTFGYMAPEQFQGRAMPASDVYSVGATVLSLVSGKEPEDLPHKGLAIDVRAVLGMSVQPALASALTAMLEPDPDKRPSKIGPVLSGLMQSSRPPQQQQGGRPSRSSQPSRAPSGSAPPPFSWGQAPSPDLPWAPSPPPPPPPPPPPFGREGERRHQQRWQKKSQGIPWFILFFISIALTFAQVGIVIVLRGILPVLFSLLSIVFGKGMREAAQSVSEGGKRAAEMVGKARDAMWARVEQATDENKSSSEAPNAAVSEPRPERRVRVDETQPSEKNAEKNAEEEAEAQAEREAEEALAQERKEQRRRSKKRRGS